MVSLRLILAMVKLNVPLFRQPHPDYCVPTCLKMILEYLRERYGNKVPRLSISTIAETIETLVGGGGTTFDDVTRINERLLASEPSVEFSPEYPCEWREIVEENEKGKPIIAWIWLSSDRASDNREHGCGHSVVIFDINVSEGVIYYNDPIHGNVDEDIGRFISKWEHEDVNKTLIKVKVGERVQRKIPEYAMEEEGRG